MFSIAKAQILFSQNKHGLAEKEVRGYLTENPSDCHALSLLSLVLQAQQKYKDALAEAKAAVGADPNSDYAHYVLSHSYLHLKNPKKAKAAIGEAVRLAPYNGDYMNLLALLLNDEQKHEEALQTIEDAMNIDPEEGAYKNTKAIILRSMNRTKEAEELSTEALADNPEDHISFTTKGWSLLDSNKPAEALEHFKMALAINPQSEYAKSGMVMGLKAQNSFFNLFYRFYVWMASLSPKTRWIFMIGLIVLFRLLEYVRESSPQLAPVLVPILALYLVFVFLNWTINPIFNLFLRFNRYGKYALDRGEIMASNILLGLIILALVYFGLYLLTPAFPVSGAIGCLFLMLTVSGAFNRWEKRSFRMFAIYNIILFILLHLAMVGQYTENTALGGLFFVFLIGAVAFTWIVQFVKN